MPNRFYIRFLHLPLLLRILLIALFVFLSFGILIHLLEPATFPTIFDGIWWSIITASTVGYGDYVPHSTWGRLAATVLILLGAGFVSSYFATLATAAVTRQDALSAGRIAFKGHGHTIIIGWNERSRELIHKLVRFGAQNIVLVDETLEANPVQSRFVHFIQGKPHMDETILKSNIDEAEKVLITADRGNDELQADMNSILTLLTIKGLCPSVKCIVEILTAEQVINAKRAGADEVIQSNKLTSVFMVNSLHSNGDGLLSDFVQPLQENRLSLQEAEDSFVGMPFKKVLGILFEKGELLIGLKRGEELIVHPSHSNLIEKGDKFLILK
ncbi:potassium channel family protein [Neobacillus sp. SM06]|uniref:potassium channel family protein n=1 Tax=Neobacillus sp. SM06 TaxID=3422492 RepID=UPI003D2714D5